MGNYSRGGGRPSGGFNRDSRGGGFQKRDGGRPDMHDAVCDKCGDNCKVPFKPTGSKPIYCSNCFDKQDSRDSRPNKFSGKRDKPRYEDRQMHDVVCDKCKKDCQVPFKPTAGKEIFCDDCFGKSGGRNKGTNEIMEQLGILNTKVDKLLKILDPKGSVEKIKKPKKVKEVVFGDSSAEKKPAKKKVAKKTTTKKVVKKKVAKKVPAKKKK